MTEVTESGSGQATARLGQAVLDTDDPAGLAAFYRELLGWTESEVEDTWVCIRAPSGIELAFQFSIGHRPPTWPKPDIPQQLHLDFYVDDLDLALARAQELGARSSGVPRGRYFVTLIDPSGHPFCLCLEPERRPDVP